MSSSEQLFDRARRHIPGGVNSPVRAFKAVGGTPVFIDRSEGAYVFDCEGKRYIDYVLSWGPMIMGHNHPRVREAVIRQSEKGLSFGAPTELEIELADRICDIMPGMDMVRMVNSGTEATMSAIRLARGYTGRDTIVKFEGCYHGHSDSLLVKAGSGALTLGVPSSPGVPAALADLTLTLTYNDPEGLRAAFAEFGERIACVIVEPVAGNMNCIPPAPGFLETLRIENLKTGLHVLIACPGFTASNIRKTALNENGEVQGESPRDESKMMSAEEVARHIARAISGRKDRLTLTGQGKLTVWLNKFFPRFLDKQVYNHMAKEPDSPFK